MKVHHLNCGSMCPIGGKKYPNVLPSEIVCHCLLVEDSQRLILVDTGLGVRDMQDVGRLGAMPWLLRPVADEKLTAFEQIKKLGYSPEDVTDIIPTHLDMDHAGGILDFPNAKVHISKDELNAALYSTNIRWRHRYRECQLSGPIQWEEFDLTNGELWNGFDCVREIRGLPPEILLVRLPGHTPGHFGVAIQTDRHWLLHAGDAYYDHRELTNLFSPSTLALKAFEKVAHSDFKVAMETQRELRLLKKNREIAMFCSHDPVEFRSCQSQML